MREWFVYANSNAAPFVSDSSTEFVEAETAEDALAKARDEYGHPYGLYAMRIYESADAYHKDHRKFVAEWLCKKGRMGSEGIGCRHDGCDLNAKRSVGNSGDGHQDEYTCTDGHDTIVRHEEYGKI